MYESNDSSQSEVISRRTWLRFSLRTTLAAMSFAGIGLYWLRNRIDAAASQKEAIRQLKAIGANVGYRHEWDYEADRFSNSPPPGGKFLRSILGDHFFLIPDIVLVENFVGGTGTLAPLGKLNTVKTLAITNSTIGDDEVTILTTLTGLQELNLYGTNITDRGLLRLARLRKLSNLIVTNSKVTEAGAAKFKELRPDCKLHYGDEADDAAVSPELLSK